MNGYWFRQVIIIICSKIITLALPKRPWTEVRWTHHCRGPCMNTHTPQPTTGDDVIILREDCRIRRRHMQPLHPFSSILVFLSPFLSLSHFAVPYWPTVEICNTLVASRMNIAAATKKVFTVIVYERPIHFYLAENQQPSASAPFYVSFFAFWVTHTDRGECHDKQIVAGPSPYRRNTAYYFLYESITLKEKCKFKQHRIGFD